MNSEFWRGKRVLVTGHTGFKGSWLCLWLQQLGADVAGYALSPPSEKNLFELADIEQGMHFSEISDIRDLAKLEATFVKFKPEIVIHMAAQPLVRYSYDHPVETYATNVMGTVNLLELVRRTDTVRAVVNVTSDKCYENREWAWGYRENEAMGGYDPYSSSKGCAELVTAAFRQSYFGPDSGVSIATARAGNVIGGGDWAEDRLVPDMIRAVLNDKAVVIRNPDAIRPWQHVLEPLRGYLLLAEKLWASGDQYASGWNFGPDESEARSVGWIVERLVSLWGENASWELDNTTQPHEAHYLKLDCAKAKTALGWYPVWDLDQSLGKLTSWYKAWHDGQNMNYFSIEQIVQYQQVLNEQTDKGY